LPDDSNLVFAVDGALVSTTVLVCILLHSYTSCDELGQTTNWFLNHFDEAPPTVSTTEEVYIPYMHKDSTTHWGKLDPVDNVDATAERRIHYIIH